MSKFYRTTRGQLITIWVFGLPLSTGCFIISGFEGNLLLFVASLFILFFLIFYTLGWIHQRKGGKH